MRMVCKNIFKLLTILFKHVIIIFGDDFMSSKTYRFVTLSKEQWKSVLSRLDRKSTIFKIINIIYESEKHTSNATTITEIIGLSNYHFPTMAVVNFGKQIYREYKDIVNFPKSHTNKSKIRYWQIVFDGNQSKHFDWVMKKEMLAAIDSLNLFSENENYIKEAVAIYQDITCFEGKERQSIVKVRCNQGRIRNNALKKYRCCEICGVQNSHLLIASHIKPWNESSPLEKADIDNIMLLCPIHDALFDKFLISFDDSGYMYISEAISNDDRKRLHIDENIQLQLTDERKSYMRYHFNRFKNDHLSYEND